MTDTPPGPFPALAQALPEDPVRPETAPHLHELDLAHMVMLVESELVAPETGATILSTLFDTETEGVFDARDSVGGGNLAGERLVTARLGAAVGGQLGLARSPAELAATGFRLFARERLLELMEALYQLRESLIGFAEAHAGEIVAAQVQGGPAQPTTFGHWALMIDSALTRDSERLVALYGRVNRSPAGAGSLAGADLPVRRLRTAELLGFDGLVENTYDAVAGHDLMLEFTGALAILTLTAARLADDLLLWAGPGQGLVSLPGAAGGARLGRDAGPAVLGQIRMLAARAQGVLATATLAERGPTALANFGRDATEQAAIDISGAVLAELPQIAALLGEVRVDAGRAARLAAREWSLAIDLAAALGRHCGMARHRAEQLAEAVMRDGLARGTGPETLTAAALARVASELGMAEARLSQEQIDAALDPRAFVERRSGTGGPGPEGLARGLVSAQSRIRLGRSRLAERHRALQAARAGLRAAAEGLLLQPRKTARA
ncbi:lyase family protein [Poseidonocella sp. HB161398]|uniref:lyase family protein n=1 Tax=Poseidonocella sp. HB161398 TaxID=2320855 RepID=UPI0011086C18|nr:lyase family protein [Poseidonocella sp. HB161398]